VAPRSSRTARPIDPWGALLLTGATVTLVLGIIEGPEQGWTAPAVWTAFAVSAVLWLAWAIVGLRSRHPMLDPRLFRLPALVAGCVGILLAFFGNFGLFYVNASLLQYVHGFGVLQAGIGVFPMIVPLLVITRFVPRLIARHGVPRVLAPSFVIISAGLFALSHNVSGGYRAYALCLFVIGVGMAPAIPALTFEITESLPVHQAGVGGGLQSATRELGSALGVAVIGSVITSAFRVPGSGPAGTVAEALAAHPENPQQVIDAYARAASLGLSVTSGLVLIAGAITVTLTRWSARAQADRRTEQRGRSDGARPADLPH